MTHDELREVVKDLQEEITHLRGRIGNLQTIAEALDEIAKEQPMTPEEARELLIQAKCEQNTHKGYRDALHTLSGLTCEYAVARRDSGTLVTEWAPEGPLFPGQSISENEQIVRRLVSEPEVIK